MRAAVDGGLPGLPEDGVGESVGLPESQITTAVDVGEFLGRKLAAMAAHASQITSESFFLALPPDMLQLAFGTEWYRRRGVQPGRCFENEIQLR